MSGTPGVDPGSANPAWNPLPWWSPFLDVRDHQWGVAIPFWKDIQARAADADVKVAIEMHPGNIVFNPSTMHRLAEETNATHIGAEMDPSHLFWQGIDPVLAVATSASSSTSRRPRTPGSTRPPRSTASSTTGSPASLRANPATCRSVAARR
jgi:hypothetical protein